MKEHTSPKSTGEIEALLTADKTRIVEQLHKVFMSHAFHNAHTVAVGRLNEIADEEYHLFKVFLREKNSDTIESHGEGRAAEGICIESILDAMSFWARYFIETFKVSNPSLLKEALQYLADYTKAYIKGYSEASPKKILKQQQEIRQALSAALQGQQKELFVKNYSINSSINAILLADLDGNVTYVNPSFLNMWGFNNPTEVMSAHSIDQIIGYEIQEIFRSLQEIRKWRGELTVKRKDGVAFDVEMLASLIIDDSGQIYGAMASFVNITERKRFELQLRRTQKMDALGQLAAGITHDFNNMFAVVKGYIQLILRDADKDSQLFEDVNQIKIAIERSSGLTKQLQYFARGVSGEYSRINLNSIIKECHELLKHTITPDIELVLDLGNDIWMVDADPSQMSHVIINFCVNARDAIIERSHIKLSADNTDISDGRITIETENVQLDTETASLYLKATPGRYIHLSVTDTGIGMTQEVMERLFEPFFSTKRAKKHSGLGLSIIYGIIEKLNGFIDVKSTFGKGSTFNVYLPATKSSSIELEKTKSEPAFALEEKTVLIADDEPQLLDVMSRFLVGYGYKVMTAKNGKEALSIFEENKDDIKLIVMDMFMPEMHGERCLTQILNIKPTAKIILITGFTTDDSVYEMARHKVSEIIEKPFDMYRLTRAIKTALKIDKVGGEN